MSVDVSIIIPTFNEESWIERTVRAALAARERLGAERQAELIVVDNGSSDATRRIVGSFASEGVRLEHCEARGAARARNRGAMTARGRLLVFADADTAMPPEALGRVVDYCDRQGFRAGICRLAELDGGLRARCWWFFWEQVRRLPLPRAKAMPAFMFCTREAFDEHGPFDERVSIGEEWPILAEIYRRDRRRLVYDRSMTALSSSRRMEQQRFGYARNFLKYVWAILHFRGRVHYTARIR